MAKAGKTYRGITYRMLPDEEQEHQLHGMCGACRFVWNFFLARNQKEYAESQANGTPAPSTRYFDLSSEFTQLSNDPEYAWLQEYSFHCVRHTVRELSQAFKNCFAGRARKPRFKSKHKTTPSCTIPDGVPKQARVYKQGKNWYV